MRDVLKDIGVRPDRSAMADAPDQDLLLALYRGPLETPLWSDFLALLRHRLGVDYASLAFRRLDVPWYENSRFVDSDGPRGNRGVDVLEGLHSAIDSRYVNLPAGEPFLVEEILDLDNPMHVAYLTDYLHPRGHRHMLLMRVVEPSRANAWLHVSRRDEPIDPAARACLRALAPHLATAIRTLAAVEQADRRARTSSYAIRRLNVGSVILDGEGGIIDLDETARHLLGDAGVLRGGGLTASGRIDIPRSRQAARDALDEALSPEAPRSRVLHLSDDPWLDLLVVPLSDRPVAGLRTPAAIGYVHGGMVLDADRAEQLMELFGLTRAEAGLAVAICNGCNIGEAAEGQGLSLETARTYSKRIYSKTGTRGQADLVRLILASVIVLA